MAFTYRTTEWLAFWRHTEVPEALQVAGDLDRKVEKLLEHAAGIGGE